MRHFPAFLLALCACAGPVAASDFDWLADPPTVAPAASTGGKANVITQAVADAVTGARGRSGSS